MSDTAERCVTEQLQSLLRGFAFTSSLQEVNLQTGGSLASQCVCSSLNKNKIQNYPIYHICKSCLSQEGRIKSQRIKKTEFCGEEFDVDCSEELIDPDEVEADK